LRDLLWQPMGASCSAYITVDRFGAPRVAGGMCATVRDLALVGELLVQDGARDGKQIVPAAWIADIASNGDAAAWKVGSFAPYFPGIDIDYRSKWYIERPTSATEGPMLFGVGVHGQNLFVDAKRALVIAKVSSQAQPLDAAKMSLTSRWVAAVRAEI